MNHDERWSTDARERRADVTNVERFRLEYIDEITFNKEGAADRSYCYYNNNLTSGSCHVVVYFIDG